MGQAAEDLKKATGNVLRLVVQAAAAQDAADKARAEGSPALFNVAQAHRQAEKDAHEALDKTIAAALAAIRAGDMQIMPPQGDSQS